VHGLAVADPIDGEGRDDRRGGERGGEGEAEDAQGWLVVVITDAVDA
jgi:hypothetical protein